MICKINVICGSSPLKIYMYLEVPNHPLELAFTNFYCFLCYFFKIKNHLFIFSESIGGYDTERRLSRQSIHVMNGLHTIRSAKGPLPNVSM